MDKAIPLIRLAQAVASGGWLKQGLCGQQSHVMENKRGEAGKDVTKV